MASGMFILYHQCAINDVSLLTRVLLCNMLVDAEDNEVSRIYKGKQTIVNACIRTHIAHWTEKTSISDVSYSLVTI